MKTNYLLLSFFCLFFMLSCAEDEMEPAFSIETTGAITLDSEKNAQTAFSFTSTCGWQATSDADWLSVSPDSGEGGTHTLSLTAVSENDTKESRTATINLTSGNLSRQIAVTQDAAGYVQLVQRMYNVVAEGENLKIGFATNLAQDKLTVSSADNDWLVQGKETKSVTSRYVVSLTVLPNTDTEPRTVYLYFVEESEAGRKLLETVTITQSGLSKEDDTDYSADKTVHVLQTASIGNGIPIVLMGDGFLDTDIADGTYDKVMEKAFANLFTEEPMKSLKAYFNGYAVRAVSKDNSFGSGYSTAFGCVFEGGGNTGISGNNSTVMEYVQCVDGVTLSEAVAVVVLNSSVYAGTTYFGFIMNSKVSEFAIAFCPIIDNLESERFRQVLAHEAVGHGFAKLKDEYAYEANGTMPSSEISQERKWQSLGWAQNVDFTDSPQGVLWNKFLSDSRYASEGLGVYEGACTYVKGAYRSSEESLMNRNTGGFNAPSRMAIYNKVMKQGIGTQPTYEEFATFDTQYAVRTGRLFQTRASEAGEPFARPRFTNMELLK